MTITNDLPSAVPIQPKGFDWNSFKDASLTHYSDYWDNDASYFDNVRSLYNRCIWHKHNQDVISHIAATYACCHSLAMQFCPILFYQGKSGSAKSESAKLIAAIRETSKDILGAQCTFASIRNVINTSRWYVYSQYLQDTALANEKPTILVWADIKEADLSENRQLYSLLRNGCDRKEDKLLIAGEAGQNQEFFVFCPKIISSVEAFYSYPKWSELKRRILLIHTDILDNSVSAETFRDNQLCCDEIDFTGCFKHFNNFWSDENLLKLAHRMKHGKAKHMMLQSGFTEHECKSSLHLLLQHSILNDCDLKQSIEIFHQYWLMARSWLEVSDFGIESVLTQLLSEYWQIKVDGIPLAIEHSKCIQACKDASMIAKSKDIGVFMVSKGFKAVKKNNKHYWIESL